MRRQAMKYCHTNNASSVRIKNQISVSSRLHNPFPREVCDFLIERWQARLASICPQLASRLKRISSVSCKCCLPPRKTNAIFLRFCGDSSSQGPIPVTTFIIIQLPQCPHHHRTITLQTWLIHLQELGFAYLSVDDVYEELPQARRMFSLFIPQKYVTLCSDSRSHARIRFGHPPPSCSCIIG